MTTQHVIHELEIRAATGRRLTMTTLRTERGYHTIIGTESKSGRTVDWITITPEQLEVLAQGARQASNDVMEGCTS